jgi:pimeloyl-ACP methyl ester carboxylesterase
MDRRNFVRAAAGAAATVVAAGGTLGWVGRGMSVMPASGGGPDVIDAKAFHGMRRFAPTAFGRIAYVERGRGPAALFVHGLPLNGFQWRGALERLSTVRRCIAPDSMGLGYSEIPERQSLAPEAQAGMLAAFLDELGISDVDLVASDSGGAVAQIFVARWPERVRTLLLTNCDVHEDSPPPALLPVIEAARAGTFVDNNLVPQLRDRAAADLPTGLARCCYTTPSGLTDEAIRVYLTPLASSPRRKAQLHDYCIELARNPLLAIEPALRRSPVPMRVVWGTGDTIFAPTGPDWLDRTFPRSRGIRRLDGAGLFWPEEMPEVVAEEARRLWSA